MAARRAPRFHCESARGHDRRRRQAQNPNTPVTSKGLKLTATRLKIAIARCWVDQFENDIAAFRIRRAVPARAIGQAKGAGAVDFGYPVRAIVATALAATSAQITAKTQPPTATARIISPLSLWRAGPRTGPRPLGYKVATGFENRLTGSGWAEMVRGTRMRKS